MYRRALTPPENRALRREESGIEGRKDRCPSCEMSDTIPSCISDDDLSYEVPRDLEVTGG